MSILTRDDLPPSLNGGKTRPLSDAAKTVLYVLAQGPIPRQEINPGVSDRLERESLVEVVDLPSPYKTHKGANIRHTRLTAAGHALLREGVIK
jgi:hypothetical protein